MSDVSPYSPRTAARDLFPDDGSILVARGGKSLMIRISTPGLTPEGDQLDEQHDKIADGLESIGRLSDWFGQYGNRLRDLLS